MEEENKELESENEELQEVDAVENECLPQEFKKMLEQVPEEDRPRIRKEIKEMSMRISASGVFREPHPMIAKIKPEHIAKLLDNSEKDSERDFRSKTQDRVFVFAVLVILLIFFSLVVFIFRHHMSDVMQLLLLVLTNSIAFAGGYGVARNKNNQID